MSYGWKIAVKNYYQVEERKKAVKRSLQKRIILFLLWCLPGWITPGMVTAQTLTQTVRGRVIDQEAQSPLVGANIVVVGTNPLLGGSTDAEGTFRIEQVPVGRHNLKISCIGYEEAQIPELMRRLR